MSLNRKYKGYKLRNRIFIGFLIVCLLSFGTSAILSFVILRDSAKMQSQMDFRNKSESLMAYLDYAISHAQITTQDIPSVLESDIFEIADINKHDIIIYDLKGNYLLSNKSANLVEQKKIPDNVLAALKKTGLQYDEVSYDEKLKSTFVSSYIVLKNNMLEDIAYVYFPYYHNESSYMEVFNRYFGYIIGGNILIILLGVCLSWFISNNLTQAIRRFTVLINKINLFDKNLTTIKYYNDDELNALVKAYNKMILEISDQRARLSYVERQEAWHEMAKQVAHEVKNPLTPMKLMMQNFERKFDPNDPNIIFKVKNLSQIIIDQIDVISRVANAFSEFSQLPAKNNEVINLNKEVSKVASIFNEENIFIQSNDPKIKIYFDRDYLVRIITNLLANATQAKYDNRELIIKVNLEKKEKRIKITISDNGVGIMEDDYERIFEPNFTSKNSGMGIGLTMVKRMIEEYGGTITVESKVGEGTTFIISLPSNL